jgi:hypothetical protein
MKAVAFFELDPHIFSKNLSYFAGGSWCGARCKRMLAYFKQQLSRSSEINDTQSNEVREFLEHAKSAYVVETVTAFIADLDGIVAAQAPSLLVLEGYTNATLRLNRV